MANFQDISASLINQLRIFDPAISCAEGTPERLIIDSVAQALADSQLDLTTLQGSLDFESKFGTNLDQFLALFGFARQQPTVSTGFVIFSTPAPNTMDVTIPQGTQVMAPNTPTTATVGSTSLPTINIFFATTQAAILRAGQTQVVAPIQSTAPGSQSNVAANTITTFVGTPVIGVTQVTNNAPTTGGADPETDEQFKVRFRNTVFRNVSGTEDMYAALAVALANTTKANVVGPISTYRDYLQVPSVDDASVDPEVNVGGNGVPGEWTTGLSTIPYSKYIYDSVPVYLINNQDDSNPSFYREDVDFRMNTDGVTRYRGDTYRNVQTGTDLSPLDPITAYSPNVTLLNVYSGTDTTVEAPRPGDLLLFEHSYMSKASRNDQSRRVFNAVDVFVNGASDVFVNTVIPVPQQGSRRFVNDPTSAYYWQNYRRFNEPEHRPILGNLFTPLYWQPVDVLPSSIVANGIIYYRDIHYWLVEDVSPNGRTIRAKNGIEWSIDINGEGTADAADGPYTGPKIFANTAESVEVNGYGFNKNIADLQTNLESAKQVTTDVLAHEAKMRYFKLDVTVMYTQASNIASSNSGIQGQINNFFNNLYFGSVIQLSDLLAAIHSEVDNVRWSREFNTDLTCVVECDVNGQPLLNVMVDRVVAGNSALSINEVQQFYLTGEPNGGTYTISQGTITTQPIAYDATANQVKAALGFVGIPATSVTGSGTPFDPFIVTFSTAPQALLVGVPSLTSDTTLLNLDFFLKDDELPALPAGQLAADTLPGMIIRDRVQNTWRKR